MVLEGFAVWVLTDVWRLDRHGIPPTPKIWNRGLTGLALGVCVCVCVCVCVSGCGGGAPYPIGGAGLWSTRAHTRVYVKIFSEGMMHVFRVLEQLGG